MVKSLQLINFKSHNDLELNFDKATAIVGKNAAGKTNVLEAIYYTFMTKSFRSPQKNLINRDSDFMKVNTVYDQDKSNNIEYRLKKSGKSLTRTITINSVKKKPADIIGIQPVVIFVPDDTRIITDGPQFRRNLINSILVQTNKQYLQALNKLQKVLNQRNKLLYSIKNKLTTNKDQLFVYNLQLTEPISEIYKLRDELIAFMNEKLSEKYSSISSEDDKVFIEYLNTLPKDKEDILKVLESHTNDDLSLGYTSKGPHKDDLFIALNGLNTREDLSRGENRTLSLALKLCEIDYINLKNGASPILLLDDVLSELDDQRQSHLLEQSKNQQTIITSTEMQRNIKGYKTLEI